MRLRIHQQAGKEENALTEATVQGIFLWLLPQRGPVKGRAGIHLSVSVLLDHSYQGN